MYLRLPLKQDCIQRTLNVTEYRLLDMYRLRCRHSLCNAGLICSTATAAATPAANSHTQLGARSNVPCASPALPYST